MVLAGLNRIAGIRFPDFAIEHEFVLVPPSGSLRAAE